MLQCSNSPLPRILYGTRSFTVSEASQDAPSVTYDRHEPLDIEQLAMLAEEKDLPAWNSPSRENTPEYSRPPARDLTEYWQRISEGSRQILFNSGMDLAQVESIRCRISSANYWEIESEHYQAEVWRLRKEAKDRTELKAPKDTPEAFLHSGPISSRLRKRAASSAQAGTSKGIASITKSKGAHLKAPRNYSKPKSSAGRISKRTSNNTRSKVNNGKLASSSPDSKPKRRSRSRK
jgi:hypothetical protein